MRIAALFPEEADKIFCFQPQGSGIIVGMNANKPRGIQKALIQKELHALLRIVEQSQRVTAPGIRPSSSIRSSSEAKLRGRMPCA